MGVGSIFAKLQLSTIESITWFTTKCYLGLLVWAGQGALKSRSGLAKMSGNQSSFSQKPTRLIVWWHSVLLLSLPNRQLSSQAHRFSRIKNITEYAMKIGALPLPPTWKWWKAPIGQQTHSNYPIKLNKVRLGIHNPHQCIKSDWANKHVSQVSRSKP